jgi:hypothetical protein
VAENPEVSFLKGLLGRNFELRQNTPRQNIPRQNMPRQNTPRHVRELFLYIGSKIHLKNCPQRTVFLSNIPM